MSMQADLSNDLIPGEPPVLFVTSGSLGTATNVTQTRVSITRLQERREAVSQDHEVGKTNESGIAKELGAAMSKIRTIMSRFSMYLCDEWRTSVLAQIDDLLDPEDWHEDDQPIDLASFYTFLRTVIHLELENRPGFGISNSGNLIAAWTKDKNRLILEFAPDDSVKWALSLHFGENTKRATGTTDVSHLREVLDPYGLTFWISDDIDTSS